MNMNKGDGGDKRCSKRKLISPAAVGSNFSWVQFQLDLIYGMRALAPHCEYHKAQSCNKQNSLSMFGSALRISGEKPDSDLRTEHASGSAHKSTLGVPNRASIFVNHFAASVSDSTYLVH